MNNKLYFLFSVLLSGCLTTLSLFNLPLFYELSKIKTIWCIMITSSIFLLLIYFAGFIFIIPFYRNYTERDNKYFLVTLSLIVFFTISFSSIYYWSGLPNWTDRSPYMLTLWNSTWLFSIKSICIVFASIGIALFLFGITEQIIKESSKDDMANEIYEK